MNKLAIIVIGYNRPHSLSRVLLSLQKANYHGDTIDLIISLDKSTNKEIINVAEKFEWNNGNKIIKKYPERLGLRKHILQCGSYLVDYDAAAILEDDIVVSPEFYPYMRTMVNKYIDNMDIAGVSLYTHSWNVLNNRPFYPIDSKYDIYISQFAQSWGQIWFKNQWNDFYRWYKLNNTEFQDDKNIPYVVRNWPKSSWLKYHIKYCVENNKYFIYPYTSYATNFSDVGEHRKYSSASFQVPLQINFIEDIRSPEHISELESYDAHFEYMHLYKYLGLSKNELCVDLYGTKEIYNNSKYVISSKKLDYKILNSYGLMMRPHEMNIIYDIKGQDLFLYDTSIKQKNTIASNDRMKFLYYDVKDVFNIRITHVIKFMTSIIEHRIKNKINKFK